MGSILEAVRVSFNLSLYLITLLYLSMVFRSSRLHHPSFTDVTRDGYRISEKGRGGGVRVTVK